MKAALIALFLPSTLLADAISTDFDLVFENHIDRVTRFGAIEVLKLNNGIVLRRKADGSYSAFDMSALGPVGCTLPVAIGILANGRACPKLIGDKERKSIEELLVDFSTYFEANNVPQRPREEILEHFEAMIDKLGQASFVSLPEQCVSLQRYGVVNKFVEALLSEESLAKHYLSMSVPRLPLFQPCRPNGSLRRQ